MKEIYDARGKTANEIAEAVFKVRGIEDPYSFLNPPEEDLIPMPRLKETPVAARALMDAAADNKRILIFADTDTDGVTSGAIMYNYISDWIKETRSGAKLDITINEGKAHGLDGQDLERFKNCDLLIITDSLDADTDNYRILTESGVSIIVLDHHLIDDNIPYEKYVTLVSSQNPNYPNKELSGAGVAWKFCKYLSEFCGVPVDADKYLDLAACGIVADMVDMTVPENRFIASRGFELVYNPALTGILGGREFNSTSVRYSVAPLINAANRMKQNDDALRLFTETTGDRNAPISRLRSAKKKQTALISELKPIKEYRKNNLICEIIDTEYGITGLLGNKLMSEYEKPVLVLKEARDGSLSGSLRAPAGCDLMRLINESGYGQAFGHEYAAGITVMKDKLDDLLEYLSNVLEEKPDEPPIEADILINPEDIDRCLADKIGDIDRISGTGFPQIRFMMKFTQDYRIRDTGKHLYLHPTANSDLIIIKWNYPADMADTADEARLFDDVRLCVTGTLDSGHIGRDFCLQFIVDELWTEKVS